MDEINEMPFSFGLLCDVHIVKNELAYYEQFYGKVELLFERNDKELQEEIEKNLKMSQKFIMMNI